MHKESFQKVEEANEGERRTAMNLGEETGIKSIEENCTACINKVVGEMELSQLGLQSSKDSPGSTVASPSLGTQATATSAAGTKPKTKAKKDSTGASSGSKARHVKSKIAFQASSMERRNVDKHLVRYILLNHNKHKTEVLDEYKRFMLDESKYDHSCKLLASLRDEEKCKEGMKMKRDYANIVSIMLSNDYLKAILKICLIHSLQDLQDKRSKRVKDKNRSIYISALKDYLTALTNH